MSKVRPLLDKVLVEPVTEESKTSSGIIIPETVDKEKPQEGIVVAVGAGTYQEGKHIPVSLKEGDRVLFSHYGYDEIVVEGKKYLIIREGSILAVIE